MQESWQAFICLLVSKSLHIATYKHTHPYLAVFISLQFRKKR